MIHNLFIFGASYLFLLSFLIGGIYFLQQKRTDQKQIILFSIITLTLIYTFALIAGHSYVNPRPFVVENFTPLIPHSPDNGFPSDHVLLVASIASVFTFFNIRVALVLWIITLLVGISRVYVGVHHPIDVLASALITFFAAYITHIIFIHVSHKKVS